MIKEEAFLRALELGEPMYLSERLCRWHGKVDRYTRNKGCVTCAKQASAKQYIGKVGKIRRITADVHVDDVQQARDFLDMLLAIRLGAANAQRRS